MRLLAALVALAASAAQAAPSPQVEETAIDVPPPIPVGWLFAWKPSILTVRLDSGQGGVFGSDKLQPLRGLVRYTNTLFSGNLLARAEIEGGRFQTDTQSNQLIGTDGYDFTVRLLGGTATKISQDFTVTASAGLLTRYQRGRAVSGAPNLGILGLTSNLEFEYRFAPVLSASFFVEGGLAPIPYGAQDRLGNLSDASELRGRIQLSLDLSATSAIDFGYDFTRWHLAFSKSTILNGAAADQALLIEEREHALTLGFRFKP